MYCTCGTSTVFWTFWMVGTCLWVTTGTSTTLSMYWICGTSTVFLNGLQYRNLPLCHDGLLDDLRHYHRLERLINLAALNSFLWDRHWNFHYLFDNLRDGNVHHLLHCSLRNSLLRHCDCNLNDFLNNLRPM